jgi:hypothetical protein
MQPEKPFYRNMRPFCKKKNGIHVYKFSLKLDDIRYELLEGFYFLKFIFIFSDTENALGGVGVVRLEQKM